MSDKDVVVAQVDELAAGEMKQVSANGTEILLARVGAEFHAIGAYCTHYGAPLVDGALSGDRVICPLHHSCFHTKTGNLLEPPALDALPGYECRVENGQVMVNLPDGGPDRRTPKMAKRDPANKTLFVIVGGGAAGYTAAQTLREDGFTGRVVMITRESRLPYDRPNLSKDYLQGNAQPEWMPLRPEEFFTDQDIKVIKGKEVERIDAATRTIVFANGDSLICDGLLVATGGEPRKLPFQSEDQENVFLLRSFDDADAIIAAAEKGKRAIVIGASFIGMEVASSLAARGVDVTIVAPGKVPFEKILGPEIGRMFQDVHREKGIKFKFGVPVTGFAGTKMVTAVTLKNGEQLPADLVVVGVGVKPATELLKGVALHTDGGVIVDQYLRAAEGVYAAGDIAYFPSALTGERTRIEHWRTAMQQGRTAAHNLAGNEAAFAGVPFFWTQQFDASLLYVGHASEWDEIFYLGDVAARDFVAFYLKGDRVMAVASMKRDRETAAIEELMKLDKMPPVGEIKTGSVNFVTVLSKASA